MSGLYIVYPPPGGGGGGGGIASVKIGNLDSNGSSSAGASVTGGDTVVMQTANALTPGLVSSASQTFSGVKTFNNGFVSVGSVSMSAKAISNVLDPAGAQDAATKNYVDTQLNAFQPLEAVSLASTVDYPGILAANILTITATGAISVDGSTPNANDRILLKNQATGAQNGVYVVTGVGSVGVSPVLTRATDYNTAAEVNSGASIPVISGSTNKFTTWIQTATIVTINVDSLVFTQYSANPQNVPNVMGALDGASAKATGATIGSSSLYLQSASTANPGIVSSAAQSFAGVKTFVVPPQFSSLSPSAQLVTGSGGTVGVGSVSLTSQVTGNLPLSQTQGSLSLTAQVVGVLPQVNLTLAATFTQATLGSVTFTSSAGGAAYTVKFPGAQGASGTFIQNDSAGNLSWVAPPAAVTGSVSQTSSAGGAAYTIRWPGAQGTSSFSLAVNDGAGNLSWSLTTGTNVQTFSSGSGVYTPSNGVIAFKATITGGGGGGGTGVWDGTSGTSSYLIISSGTFVFGNGGGGVSNNAGGLGGIGVGGDINLTGNPGASGMGLSGAAALAAGNGGGSCLLGGGGRGGNIQTGVGGGNGIANSGGGGGGSTIGSSSRSGGGGAGTAVKFIKAPLTTYSYYIGAGAVGSSIGGASGGSGFIMIEEFFP